MAICLSPKHIDLIPYEGGLLPPPFFSDSRGRLSLHLENKRLCSHILKSVAGSGTQPQVSRCLFASFSALEKEDIHLTPRSSGEVAAPADGESENYSRRKPKTITSAYFSTKPPYRISSFTKNSTTPRRLAKTLRTPRLKPCRRIRKGIRYFLPF